MQFLEKVHIYIPLCLSCTNPTAHYPCEVWTVIGPWDLFVFKICKVVFYLGCLIFWQWLTLKWLRYQHCTVLVKRLDFLCRPNKNSTFLKISYKKCFVVTFQAWKLYCTVLKGSSKMLFKCQKQYVTFHQSTDC